MSKVGDYLESVFSLNDKNILITGAAGGLGEIVTEALAKAGGTVFACDYDDSVNRLTNQINQDGGKAFPFQLDVTNSIEIEKLVDNIIQEFQHIDVLINLAGINRREGLLDVAEDTFDSIMDVNLKGVFTISQIVGRQMFKQKFGNVINIGSHNDKGMLGGCSVYGASKSGVIALTRSMAVEWAQYNIRANAISPGHFLTKLSKPNWEHEKRTPWLRERIAMKRPGYPEELVGLVILLASDASSYMSGQTYRVDGGCLAGGDPWDFDTEYK